MVYLLETTLSQTRWTLLILIEYNSFYPFSILIFRPLGLFEQKLDQDKARLMMAQVIDTGNKVLAECRYNRNTGITYILTLILRELQDGLIMSINGGRDGPFGNLIATIQLGPQASYDSFRRISFNPHKSVSCLYR